MNIKMSIYYRGANNKLRQIDTWALPEAIEEVRQAVIQDLKDNMEPYTKPVLVAIRGGKA